MQKPLDDICVLDLTQGTCGPFCTQILRDLGANLIKIEPPCGDISRREATLSPEGSTSYAALNRGKKSVVLDLDQEKQKELFFRLAERADVIVEDLGPGKSKEKGIDYPAVRKRNSNILYLSITGYGHTGSFRDYSDEDAIIQALSGFMSITGELGGAYRKAGVPIADIYTGIYGAIGILTGVIHRRKTKTGLFIDLAKMNVMLTAMPDVISKYLNTGITTRPKGCRHQLAGFFGPIRTRDGIVICMASQDHQFHAMTEVLGLEELQKDERFDTMTKRCIHAADLELLIHEKTADMTMDELTEKLLSRKIPVGQVNPIEKFLKSDYCQYHHMIMEVKNQAGHTFQVVAPPIRFGQFPMEQTDFISGKGEFTDEVLQELLENNPIELPGKEEP